MAEMRVDRSDVRGTSFLIKRPTEVPNIVDKALL